MSVIHVELPDSILNRAREIAQERQLRVEQVVADAVREMISARDQLTYLEQRARRGRSVDIKAILHKAPDVPPMPGDEIES